MYSRCIPDELDLVHEYTRVYQSATRCISDRFPTVWLLDRYTDFFDVSKKSVLKPRPLPTKVDRCRPGGTPLQTEGDHFTTA